MCKARAKGLVTKGRVAADEIIYETLGKRQDTLGDFWWYFHDHPNVIPL
jgi:hypothetical protein